MKRVIERISYRNFEHFLKDFSFEKNNCLLSIDLWIIHLKFLNFDWAPADFLQRLKIENYFSDLWSAATAAVSTSLHLIKFSPIPTTLRPGHCSLYSFKPIKSVLFVYEVFLKDLDIYFQFPTFVSYFRKVFGIFPCLKSWYLKWKSFLSNMFQT